MNLYFLSPVAESIHRIAIHGLAADSLLAGMPMPRLNELARLRIESISFFLMVILVSAWIIGRLWNYLQTDFTWLPRLTYGKALSIVTLWGLLFVIVLTMISGARELMTPGAWEVRGATYQLADEQATHEEQASALKKRKEALERLGVALLRYAREHDGVFPDEKSRLNSVGDVWELPDDAGLTYFYEPNGSMGESEAVLAYEPRIYDDDQFVLLVSGKVQRMSPQQLRLAVTGKNDQ